MKSTMANKTTGMDAVLEKVGKGGKYGAPPANGRKLAILRKKLRAQMTPEQGATNGVPGKKPGMAIMIAIGKPKTDGAPSDASSPASSPRERIAALEARIAELEAKLAKYEEEDEETEDEESMEHETGDEDEEE